MREVRRVVLRGSDVLAVETSAAPPIFDGETLVKVRSLLVTPYERRQALFEPGGSLPAGVLFEGRVVLSASGRRSGEPVVHVPSSCDFLGDELLRRCYGGELACAKEEHLLPPSKKLEKPALQFVYLSVAAGAGLASGSALVVNKLGLQGRLLGALLGENAYFYPPPAKRAPGFKSLFVGREELEGSKWDTVLLWTLDFALAGEVLSSIESAKKVVVAPFACYGILPIPLARAKKLSVEVAWPSASELDEDLLKALEKEAFKTGEVVALKASDLPSSARSSYVLVELA